jgi:putative peptidoglycan lipid II flippase
MAASSSNWFSRSTNRKILKAMLTIGAASIALRMVGMVKEIVIAGYFGVGINVDAFMIAMILPTIVLNSVIVSIPTAMMPMYIQTRSESGKRSASQLYANVASLAIPLFLVCCAAIYVVGPPIISVIGREYSADALSLTRSLLFVVTPITILTGMRLLLSSLLNAEERFGLVAAAPSFTAISIILGVALFSDRIGIYTVAIGTLVGAALELCLLLALCKWHDVDFLPRWSGFSRGLKRVFREFGPLAFGSMLLSSTIFIDQAMAATLGPGSVASLGFGNRITTVVVGLGTGALATAVFPYFSMMVAQQNWREIRHTLFTYIRLLAYVTIPITALLLVFSDEIISLIFERGKFGAEDTQLVGSVQFFYAMQIPFHVIAMLAVRMISALQKNKILMWGTAISLVLNIILNLVFMKYMGVAGIALSTACVYAVSFIYLWSMLYVVLPKDSDISVH